MGIRSSLAGLIANAPVKTPVFSFARSVRSRSDFALTWSRYALDPSPLLVRRQAVDQRVLRRKHHVSSTVERVRPGGEDGDVVAGGVDPGRPA